MASLITRRVQAKAAGSPAVAVSGRCGDGGCSPCVVVWCGVVRQNRPGHARAAILMRSGEVVFHQTLDTVDVKQATFEASARRILYADRTKFGRPALHALIPLTDFAAVLIDAETDPTHVARLRAKGVTVVVARRPPSAR